MKAFTYNIDLIDPILVNQIGGGDPNSAVGFDFIPGSVIRGAFISKYLQSKERKTIDACDEEFRHLFFNGNVLFLNAYPLSRYGKRTLPSPLSWYVKKGDETDVDDVYDHAIYDVSVDDEKSEPIIWNKVSYPFCIKDDDESHDYIMGYNPTKRVMLHITRSNMPRVTDETSSMFRYESLDSGQIMSGAILVKDEKSFEVLSGILHSTEILRLGKSHLTSYGRVRLENLKNIDNWEEYEQDSDNHDSIVVTLLSDAIIRDEKTGSYTDDITSALGINHAELISRFVQMALRGSFNRTWNLPSPQMRVIKAGSVFVYRKDEELSKKLHKLVISGIGEKREEGFGRIAIDWQNRDCFEISKYDADTGTKNLNPDIKNIDLINTIYKRLLRTELDQLLWKKINNSALKNVPSKSQISGVRYVIRSSFAEGKPEIVINYLKEMKNASKDNFIKARIGNDFYKWIELLFKEQDKVWGEINAISVSCSLGGIDEESKNELKNEMALEYSIRLVDGVLHKAQKEANNNG